MKTRNILFLVLGMIQDLTSAASKHHLVETKDKHYLVESKGRAQDANGAKTVSFYSICLGLREGFKNPSHGYRL